MRAHGRPDFAHVFDLDQELEHIREHQKRREIPARTDKNLLIATWNLTNFGLQDRETSHLRLMAEVLMPFDVVAVQEVADDLTDFEGLMAHLGDSWSAVYTDIAGNQERLGYLFRKDRVLDSGLAAELAMRSYEREKIRVQVGDIELEESFTGFNRNPFMMSFSAIDPAGFDFTVVNVHLYWSNFTQRLLEAEALGKWAASRVKKAFPPNNDIILLGDFNMPRVTAGDRMFDTLESHGVRFPKHNTELIGSNLAGDKHYDEVAFFPSRTAEDFGGRLGVFDFDKAVFPDLWGDKKEQQTRFFQYIRYFMADHRPLWAEFLR